MDERAVSARAAVEHLLHVARERLGMEAAFLAELTQTEQIYRATTEDAGSFTVMTGGSLPRVESYCQYVLDSGKPWVVRDTRVDVRARQLSVTAEGDFGAYIGVPVVLPDGRAYGTLCCVSHRPRPDLGDADVAVLGALADVLAHHVGQLREMESRVEDLETLTVEQLQRALDREQAAAQELHRLDRLRAAFLSAVSHELRTPLTMVRGGLETLTDQRLPSELQHHLLERLSANAERLEQLLTDLLDLNQFTHGGVRPTCREVRLDEIVRRAVGQVEHEGFAPELDLDPVVAVAAPVKMERIVVNLVTNAAIHTPEGTDVHVRLREEDDGALLIVRDHGSGVAPADREAVFTPFWQGNTAPSHRPGTGIGLSLVAAFAELHGGRAWVDDAEGGGAAFHVWIPLEGPS